MISIVMPYKNRRVLLIRTLHTISNSVEKDLEIIIVDDASDDGEKVLDLVDMFDMNIKVIEITKEQRTWNSCSIPFNIGYKAARGDIILMQSPECLHVGDVLAYTKAHINNENYICFACYAISEENMKHFKRIDFLKERVNRLLRKLIRACGTMPLMERSRGRQGNIWYCHPRHRSWAPHFTSAMMRKVLLEEFGGLDERYKDGCDYEDMEFYHRIDKSNVEIIVPDPTEAPFVIHQFHKGTNQIRDKKKVQMNADLYNNVTTKEEGWLVNDKEGILEDE